MALEKPVQPGNQCTGVFTSMRVENSGIVPPGVCPLSLFNPSNHLKGKKKMKSYRTIVVLFVIAILSISLSACSRGRIDRHIELDGFRLQRRQPHELNVSPVLTTH